MEASELDAFLAAAAGRPSAGADGDNDVLAEAGADGDNDVLAEVDGLAANEAGELVALAAACGGRRRFGQRSSELTQHARNTLVKKRQQAKLDAERAKRQRAELQLTVVVAADPGMMQLVGVTLPPVNLPMEVRAGLLLRLACLPRIRSALFDKQRKKQTNALALVSQVLQEGCLRCWEGLLATAHPGDGMGVPAAMRVLMFACQWDETSQKFKMVPAKGQTSTSRGTTTSALAAQCMVFSGSIVEKGIKHEESVHIEPFFVRTMVVAETSANFLLEGLLRSLPFSFEDPQRMAQLSAATDFFVISATVDRASANQLAAAWLASRASLLPRNIIPWCEFCAAHGVALAKGKSPMIKKLATALCSFTLWMKTARNVEALADQVALEISRSFEVRREAPSEEFVKRGRLLVKMLYGGDSNDALWRWDARSARYEKTPLLKDLEKLCQVSSFGAAGPAWVHHCFVEAGSSDALSGLPVGAACCSSRAESLKKVAEVVNNICTGRAWKVASVLKTIGHTLHLHLESDRTRPIRLDA